MKGSYPVTIEKLNPGGRSTVDDLVVIEEPIEIRIGFVRGDTLQVRPVAITMRTPGDDFDLAMGFLLSERIITSASQVREIKRCGDKNENVVRVDLVETVDVDLKKLQRNFYVTSSCGVCGKSSLEALELVGYQAVGSQVRVPFETLRTMPDTLKTAQRLFEKTGGTHACGVFSTDGTVVAVREDVGRHNALDKLIGHLARVEVESSGFVLVLSGRASFELIQKALAAQIELVASVGAPSSLAVETAKAFGMTLVGFLGEDRANVYSHPERISAESLLDR